MLCKCGNYQRNYASRLSPALSGSSEKRRFERSDAIGIRDGIIFDFYTGLPHVRVRVRELAWVLHIPVLVLRVHLMYMSVRVIIRYNYSVVHFQSLKVLFF